MSGNKTTVEVAHFGTVCSTSNRIDTRLKRAVLNFELNLAGGANPYLLTAAVQRVARVDKHLSISRRQNNCYTMSVSLDLSGVSYTTNSRFVARTVQDILSAIEQMEVPMPEPRGKKTGASRSNGRKEQGKAQAVRFTN